NLSPVVLTSSSGRRSIAHLVTVAPPVGAAYAHASDPIDRDAMRLARELASCCWRGVCNRLLEHGYHLVKLGSLLSCTGEDIDIAIKDGGESHEPNDKNVPAWLAGDGFVGGLCEDRMVSGGGCGTGHRAERRDDHRRYGKSADAVRSDRDRGREDQGRGRQKHGLSCRCQ